MQQDYMQVKAADWRWSIKQNQRRTIMVMITFVLIYLFVGFLVDLYLHGGFSQGNFEPVFSALITFQIPPMATISMGVVAVVAILVTILLHDRIMLLGTNYFEVTPETAGSLAEKQLYNIVEELKIAAGLRYMPRIFIMETPQMNAFASGYSEKSAMIAVTRGLLENLNRDELQAVMAHELSHIRHGDIKLTLMAVVLSNIMLVVVDILFYNIIFGRGDDRKGGGKMIVIALLIRYLLPLITVLLMLYLSRSREYMADAGAVELMRDSTPLAHALLKISGDYKKHQVSRQGAFGRVRHENLRQAAYIFDPSSIGVHAMQSVATLFSTHPSVQDRLKALGFQEQQ